MTKKQAIIATAQELFTRWETLLGRLPEAEVVVASLPMSLSVKDVVAHLHAWQQRTIARLEAARLDREPQFPAWPAGLDPEAEDVDQINGWIFATYRDRPWPEIHQVWREGFLQFIALTEAIPEGDLLAAGKYPWLDGHPLSLIPQASCEHHAEHLEELEAELRNRGVDR